MCVRTRRHSFIILWKKSEVCLLSRTLVGIKRTLCETMMKYWKNVVNFSCFYSRLIYGCWIGIKMFINSTTINLRNIIPLELSQEARFMKKYYSMMILKVMLCSVPKIFGSSQIFQFSNVIFQFFWKFEILLKF